MLSPKDKAMRVKQVYSELDRKFEEQETQRTAAQQQIPYINLYGFPVDTQALILISQEQAEAFGAAVFFKEGHNVKLGTINPLDKIQTIINQLEREHYKVEPYLISHSSLKHMIEGYGTILKADRHSQKIEINTKASSITITSLKDLSFKLKDASATEM